MLRVTDAIALQDHEVVERFVRAIGARGQNLRREATAVELRLDISRSSLPTDAKERLRVIANKAVTIDDVLIVASRNYRSQLANRRAARARLLNLLRRAAMPLKKHRLPEPPAEARRERLASKKHRSALKATRTAPREA